MTQEAQYQFSVDWFDHNIPYWKKVLRPFQGEPIRVLEIGVFEGKSTVWLLENIITHPDARHIAVDTFEGSMEHQNGKMNSILQTLEERFKANVAATGRGHQVEAIRSASFAALIKMNHNKHPPFDMIYIDGSHMACDVLADATLAWPLLKKGGVMIFDDYQWKLYRQEYKNPGIAVDAFLACYRNQLKVLFRAYQVAVRKRSFF